MRLLLVVAAAVTALPLAAARAQTPTVPTAPSFSVERLTPAPGPGTFWQVEDGDVAPHLHTTFGLFSSVMSRPLVVYHALSGEVLTEPVRTRAGTDLLIAIGLFDELQLGLALPVVVYQEGDRLDGLELPEMPEPLAATAFGDVRLHAKARIVEPAFGYGLATAAAVVLTLPTGDASHFAGEGSVTVEARLVGSFRARRWAAAANLGARFREEVGWLDPSLVVGNEIAWGVAAQAAIPGLGGDAVLLGEVAGAWGDAGGPSPSEARVGVRVRVAPAWVVGAAGGGGIGRAGDIGAPAWRGILELRHDPRPRQDTDRDGIPDVLDRCPIEHEDVDGVDDRDGCIDPDDDGDGIPDAADRCERDPEDLDRFKDDDGCPEPDNDEDGILDGVDKCPNQPEDLDGFADDDGCPDGDNDGDGLLDARDACPDAREDFDGQKDEDGCPDLDDDGDGVPDARDLCPAEVEDLDGWLDDDGCLDADDDRDGVPDGIDRCLDQPETVASLTDVDDDGCPDGPPIVRPSPSGAIWLGPEAQKALAWKRGQATLTPQAEKVVVAIARAAHRAGWDEAEGPALLVTVFDDAGGWSDLAQKRSEQVVERLRLSGVEARVEPAPRGRGIVIGATKEALEAGRSVPVRQASP